MSSVVRVLLLLLAATISGWPLDAVAQTVAGVVQESETGNPLPTVVITLLDGDGHVHGRTLSDIRGRFSLSAPGPGRYGLRAERIGRRTVEVAPFEVGAGEEVVRELVMSVEAISLEGIEVVGHARCRLRPDEGVELARVWDQARIALQVEALSREAQALRFRLRNFTRELSPDLRRVVDEEEETSSTFAREPYRSAPVAGLMSEGWIQADPRDGSWDYFAPDAAALLSDPFQEGHCFRLVRDEEHPGLLGLGFQPVGRSTTPSVEGALWLDEATSELRFLTYRYTNVPPVAGASRRLPPISPEAMGGRVEFLQLPGGAWVVSRWYIRAPLLRVATRTVLGRTQEEVMLGGVSEIGGEVLEVRDREGSVIDLESIGETEPGRILSDDDPIRVEGRIEDWTDGRPVADAVIRLVEAELETTTDPDGRFVFREVTPGAYRFEIEHIAYGIRHEILSLEGGRLVHIAVRLPTRAIALEGFTVTATPRTPVEEIRLRSGTRRDIVAGAELARAELRGERVIDVVRRMPGVQVIEGGEGEGNLPFGSVCVELRRATRGILTGGGCDMVLVIVNGARVSGGIEDLGPFLAGLSVADLESIELLSPMQAGMIYGLSGSSGAIVLHSRGRGPYLDPERNPE